MVGVVIGILLALLIVAGFFFLMSKLPIPKVRISAAAAAADGAWRDC